MIFSYFNSAALSLPLSPVLSDTFLSVYLAFISTREEGGGAGGGHHMSEKSRKHAISVNREVASGFFASLV